jgi:tetratricopeptide (TPR) repeat protein
MALCQRPGLDWRKTWSALRVVFLVQWNSFDLRKACETSAELIARAEEHGSTEHIALAVTWLACARMPSGDFDLAAQGLDRAIALWESIAKPATDPSEQRGILASNRAYSALNLWFLGYPDRALERVGVATAMAGEPGSRAFFEEIGEIAIIVLGLCRELERMREQAQAVLVSTTESGDLMRGARCEVSLGLAQAMAGDPEGGLARMRATGLCQDDYQNDIAAILCRLGQFDEALVLIDGCFPIIERTGQRGFEAEVYRVKGEVLFARDPSNVAPAEQSFRTAIEISRKQKAKSWELRAVTSLARLLDRQGKRDEARAVLADIYGWFTEGFGTADLTDAKALLAELAPSG